MLTVHCTTDSCGPSLGASNRQPGPSFFAAPARVAALLVAGLLLTWGSQEANAQEFFLRGGAALGGAAPTISEGNPEEAPLESETIPFGEVGLDLDVLKGVMINGTISYQENVAVGGGLSLLPLRAFDLKPNAQFQPFLSVGGGRFVSGPGLTLAHAGLGLRWDLPGALGLNLGVSGRSLFESFDSFEASEMAIAPKAGISFSFTNDVPETEEVVWEETPQPREEDVVTAGPVSTEPADGATGTLVSGGGRQTTTRRTVARSGGGGAYQRPGAPGPAPSAPWSNTSGTGKQDRGYVFLSAGTFTMGLTAEDRFQLQQAGRKRITLSPFWISKKEVTNGQYRAFIEALPAGERSAMLPDSSSWEEIGNPFTWSDYFRTESYADYPVVGVTYEQAARYCEFEGGRLPTEAEWEYSARSGFAGEKFSWPGYDTRTPQGGYLANYNPQLGGYAHDGFAYTAPTGTYPANAWGLQDLSGNVSEWTSDVWSSTYEGMRDYNPERRGESPSSGEKRVVRGGSWASDAFYIGVGVRSFQAGSKGSAKVGFRCVHPGNDLNISQKMATAQGLPGSGEASANSASLEGSGDAVEKVASFDEQQEEATTSETAADDNADPSGQN